MSPPVLELHSRVIQQPPNSAAVEFGVLSAELDLLEVSAENLLDPTLVAEFDREWEIVLDHASSRP